MKKYILIFVMLSTALLIADPIAPGLYETQLWQFLTDNYKTSTTLGYTDARDVLYGQIDLQPGNQLSCIYTGYTITIDPYQDPSTQAYQQGIDCEHTWPQSYGADQEPQKSDMHHLYPCKSNANSARSNLPFNDIPDYNTDSWYRLDQVLTTIPTAFIDQYSEKENDGVDCWEPREDAKGNIARSMFYFYTMYYDDIQNSFIDDQMETLYQWHLDDPADADELERTWEIASYQQNKPNPFVVDDTLIQRIWFYQGGQPVITVTSPNGGENWYTGSQYEITWVSQEYQGNVVIELLLPDQEFTLAQNQADDGSFLWNIPLEQQISSQYAVRISSQDGMISDQSDNFFSIARQIAGDDFVMISEYVEGSSYHKALEIFNGSQNILDLDGFSLKKQTNGGGSFANELFLNGSIQPWDVFVICYDNNGSGDLTDQDFVDMQTSSPCLSFNGNDAIALYYNGIMIDQIGVLNSSSDWGKDMTLIRNSNISSPQNFYNPDQWIEYPQDTFEYLGFHDFESQLIYGDIDGNGLVEAMDASLVLQFVVMLETNWQAWQYNAADVDGSTVIDCYDASLILRYINEIISTFPVQ